MFKGNVHMRKGSILAAAALLAISSGVRAESPPVADAPGPNRNPPQPAATIPQSLPPAVDRRPIMQLLDDAGLAQSLDAAHINIYGHVEGSYTYNFDSPHTGRNPFRLFDFESEKLLLNQLDLTIERRVDYHKGEWDIGGIVEIMYGADAGLIHSHGLFDYYRGPRSPENQFDLTQAYLDFAIPVGTGLRVRVGKFVNLVGYEAIDPTVGGVIDFYSRSFAFGSGYPFTHTGVLGTYDVLKNVTVTAGVTRGDEQSVKDNNGAASFLGSVNWVINDQWALYLSNSTGPEQPNDNSHYRTTLDGTLYYTLNDHTNFAGNAYYLYDAAGSPNGGAGELWALAALGAYQLNDRLTAKARVEWMHDHSGLRLPARTDLYEVTLGLTVVPFPRDKWLSNLKLRPEVRYDWSPESVFNGKDHQFTASIDAVFRL